MLLLNVNQAQHLLDHTPRAIQPLWLQRADPGKADIDSLDHLNLHMNLNQL